MALTLITGRANTGKTGRALSIYRDALTAGGRPVLILPSGPDVERVLRELTNDFSLGVDARTFDRFVADTWTVHGDGRLIITSTQRAALLLSALGSGSRGLVDLVGRAAQHLAVSGDAWRRTDALEGDCQSVSVALREYGAELTKRGLVEPAEAAYGIRETLTSEDTIIFHRFADLTPSEISFVEYAGQGDADIALTLTWEEGCASTEALDTLVDRLLPLASHERVSATHSHTEEPELARIERELFCRPEPVPGDGAVSFLMAEGPEAEADIIAGQVLDLVGGGISPERIAVVCRSLRGRAGPLKRALAEAGLRIDLDVALPFRTNSFGRAFTHAVAFLSRGDRGSLIALVRSGYFCDDGSAAQAATAGWLGEAAPDARRLLARARSLDAEKTALLEALLGGDLSPPQCLAAWNELAGRMLAQRHSGGNMAAGVMEDSLARGALARALSDLGDLEGTPAGPTFLADVLESLKVGSGGAERPGRVQVTSVERVRGRRFEALVLAGLNAGEFPSVGEDPLASDALIPLWQAAGLGKPPRSEAVSERAMLYAVVTRPRRRLLLSRLTTGAGGEDVAPSVFWEELRDFYREPAEEDELLALPQDKHLRMHEAGLAAHAASSLRAGLRAEACAHDGGTQGTGGGPRIAQAVARREAGRRRGHVRCSELASRTVFSPSALEMYARCPYLWFVSREIGGDRLEFEVDALMKGSIAHSALERAYRDASGTRIADDLTEDKVTHLAHRSVVEAIDAEGLPDEVSTALVLEITPRVRRSLRADAEFLPGYSPWAFEWSFGFDDAPTVSLGPYELRGRVDRVDVDGDKAIVLDYKLGSSGPYTAAKLREKKTIQALLYAHAVESATELSVCAALYRGLGDGKSRGIGRAEEVAPIGLTKTDLVSDDEYRDSVTWAVQEALRAAEGIRAGRLGRSGGDHCSYCPVARWCEESE